MSDDRKLEVIDPHGWRKEYPLEKTVIFIGSDPSSDIQLKVDPGAGIAARHLQLIAVPDVGYRLVNLGESGVLVGEAGDREITPRASAELTEGEQIKIGEFILILRGEIWSSGGAAGPTSRSKNIGLSLTLPKTELAPHETLEGIATVFNLGDFSGAQFDLELAGFEADCFELEPGPLLSSGADKEVMFRLYHLGHKPLAGDVKLTIRAVAPKAYPAEQVSVSRLVRVLPYYSYRLALIAPGAAKPAPPPTEQAAPADPARPPAKPAPARPPQPTPASSAETADWWSGELPVKATPAPVELSPLPESQPELETEPALARPVEPPGEQPHFIEPAPAETEQDQAELTEAESIKIEAESVSPPTELASPAPAETEPSLQPMPQPEPEPLPPEVEPTLPSSPRELAMAATPPPVAEDDWWSPIRQPEPATADQTLWSAGTAAATTGDEPGPPAQLEPEITPGEDNLPPALQGKKVLKFAASQPPPVEAKTPETSAAAGADTANWWSADESTKEAETDSQE